MLVALVMQIPGLHLAMTLLLAMVTQVPGERQECLWVFMHMYMCARINIYTCTNEHTCMYYYVHGCACVNALLFINMHPWIYMYVLHVYIAHIHVLVHVYVLAWRYMHTHMGANTWVYGYAHMCVLVLPLPIEPSGLTVALTLWQLYCGLSEMFPHSQAFEYLVLSWWNCLGGLGLWPCWRKYGTGGGLWG